MHKHQDLLKPTVASGNAKVVLPPGYSLEAVTTSSGRNKKPINLSSNIKKPDQAALDELKVKKAWEIAMGPAKQIPMNLFMSYMTGNSLQMIPIMMTLMLLWNPIKAIFTETVSAFKQLETKGNSSDILLTRAVFVICQIGSMLVGVWKLNKMGLIPNSEADWLAWKEIVQLKESINLL